MNQIEIQSYPTIFSDKFGEIQTTMFNDFQNLSICIDGVWFVGREFSTLEVQNFATLSPEQIARFDLTQIQTLHNCTFRLNIPQVLVNTNDNTETVIDWQIVYELGTLQANGGLDKELLTLTVTPPNQTPITASAGWFENVLVEILNKLNAHVTTKNSPRPMYFKNCFGCQWSDYSIFGNSSFGDLVCYVDYQADYAKIMDRNSGVDIKNELMMLMEKDTNCRKWVQEIYCCENFKPRPVGAGYRG